MFASATGVHKVLTIDERTLKVIASAPAGDYPDGIAWDPDDRRVYVSLAFIACDANATLLTLDLDRMKITGKATVGGSPDVLAFDSSLRRLYVSSESGVAPSSPSAATASRSWGRRSSRPRHTRSTPARTWCTSRFSSGRSCGS